MKFSAPNGDIEIQEKNNFTETNVKGGPKGSSG
jgi:hypothetical protein